MSHVAEEKMRINIDAVASKVLKKIQVCLFLVVYLGLKTYKV